MPQLLASSDLCNAPEVWLPKLQAAVRKRRDLHTLPEVVRDVGLVLELDAEVHSGGFALYLFNPPCRHVYDAWYVLDELDTTCVGLLSAALRRVGVSYGIEVDPKQLAASNDDDALRCGYGRLIDVVTRARGESGTLQERFARFRDRLEADADGVEGLGSVSRKWCDHDRWKETIVRRILAHRFEFLR
jgi:hypothetical protein